ncbi:MAG: archaetidylserine decarboxylase [Candidatus Aminicenantes bacterium]|nr:archaetidylserine decarboxylase [Candidatus Aminicenantes bacterium]
MKKISAPFSRLFLACISMPLLSRLWGKLMRLRRPRFLARRMIARFKNHYQIPMDEFAGSFLDYPSLADFFIRPFDPQKRPLPADGRFILSPADGQLSELEFITSDCATQVKGKTYPLGRFLAADIDFSPGWHLAIIYLSPRNYHRYHYPVSGRISGCFHGGNRLFPVNAFSCANVRKLFIKNERLITRIELKGSSLYVAAVGATFVGSIVMAYLPDGLPAKNEWRELDIPVTQMAEMGRFNMGSTIIMAIPAALVEAAVAEKGEPVRVGDPIFKIRS